MKTDSNDIPRHLAAKMKRQKELEARREAMRKNMIEQRKEEQLQTPPEKNHGISAFSEANSSYNAINTVGLAMLKELQQDKEEDAHTLFCLSVAARLRALPPALSRSTTASFISVLNEAEDRAEAESTAFKV